MKTANPGASARPLPRVRPRREQLADDPGSRTRLLAVASTVVQVLSSQPGISLRKLRSSVRAVRGRCSDGDTDAALELLGDAVDHECGSRGAWSLILDVDLVPDDVKAAITARTKAP